MANLLGKRIRKVSQTGQHEIPLRDNVVTGTSDVRESVVYKVYRYTVEDSSLVIPVFIQDDWQAEDYVVVTRDFQYGEWASQPFLVLHDKTRYKPPQQSFLCAEVADLILPADGQSGPYGVGFGFGVGTFGFMDTLKDFNCVTKL